MIPASHAPRAFTLIELLVVITIIVVLLALLAPALDKAVYQAQLAVCGTHLKGVATGAQVYAMNFGRRYPHRPGVTWVEGGWWWMPDELRNGTRGTTASREFDERPIIQGYIDLKLLLDPLSPELDISPEATDPGTYVHANYNLRYGFQFFRGATAYEPMARLGQRLGWTDSAGKEYQFNVLAGDADRSHPGAWSLAGHPDRDGVMGPRMDQNREALPGGAFGYFNQSRWETPFGINEHGTIEMNFVLDNGSVRRYDAVKWNDWQVADRLVNVPQITTGENADLEWNQLPLTP